MASTYTSSSPVLQAKKEKEQLAEDLQKELTQLRAKSKQDLEEAKSKLIIERHEHEKATSDHAVMLRELQKLLSEERRAKEKAENSRHEAEERFRQVTHLIFFLETTWILHIFFPARVRGKSQQGAGPACQGAGRETPIQI